MNLLRKQLFNKEINEIAKSPNFLSSMEKNIFSKNPKDFLFIKNLNEDSFTLNKNSNFLPLKFSNKTKNFNSLDMDDMIEFYFYQNKAEKENKNFLFIGDLDNKKHSFCAGADLKYFYSIRNSEEEFFLYNNLAYLIADRIYKSKLNNISIWNGIVMGGGLGPTIHSKFRISTESTVLAMPETKFGYFPNITYAKFIPDFLTIEEALYFTFMCNSLGGIESFLLGFSTNFILNKFLKELINEILSIKFTDLDKENQEITNAINFFQKKSFDEINENKDLQSELKANFYLKSLLKSNKNKENLNINNDNFLKFDKEIYKNYYRKSEIRKNFNVGKENLINLLSNDLENMENFDSILSDAEYNLFLMNKISREIFGNFTKNLTQENSIEILIEELKDKLNKNTDTNSSFLKFLYENCIREIESRSKFSLKQAITQNKKAFENLNFSESYDLEMELTKETFAQKEYIEGIRAFFIEKDFKPIWKH